MEPLSGLMFSGFRYLVNTQKNQLHGTSVQKLSILRNADEAG
jgi:hypothetical protein